MQKGNNCWQRAEKRPLIKEQMLLCGWETISSIWLRWDPHIILSLIQVVCFWCSLNSVEDYPSTHQGSWAAVGLGAAGAVSQHVCIWPREKHCTKSYCWPQKNATKFSVQLSWSPAKNSDASQVFQKWVVDCVLLRSPCMYKLQERLLIASALGKRHSGEFLMNYYLGASVKGPK